MIYEVIDGTLALAVCEPQNMSALHVDDEGGVFVAVVQLKLVHAEKTSLLLRLSEGFAVHRVLVREPLQINLFHRVFTKASQFGYLLVGKPIGQKIPCELKQLTGDVMVVRLEGNALHLRMPAARTAVPPLLKADCAKTGAKAQVPEHGDPAPMDVHFLTARRAERNLAPFQFSVQQVDLPACLGHLYGGHGVMKSS